jgi:hypothetical protein
MTVDRRIREGETVQWEEYELTVAHFPGQTEYHMVMVVEVDGKRVAFTGDSVSDGGDSLVQPVIFRNIVTAESHEKCARVLNELQPDILASGHGMWLPVTPEKLHSLHSRAASTRELFEDLATAPVQMGVNPGWVKLVPYQVEVSAGEGFSIHLQIHNYFETPTEVEASLVLPEGWKADPQVGRVVIAPGTSSVIDFAVAVGKARPDRLAIAADIVLDKKPLGQVTEALVTIK